MGRVLVTSPAALDHIHPMVPLAKAMVARGHDVLWVVPDDGVAPVEGAGIRAVRTGPPERIQPAEVRRRYPQLHDLPPVEVWDFTFGKLFGAMQAPSMLADLAPMALEWRPDLVVADAAEFAGHIVAAELGVPSVTKGFGPLLPARRVALAGDEVAPLWRSRGLEPRPYGGAYDHLYLDAYPPGLHPSAPAHVPRRQLLRPVAGDGDGDGSSALPLPAGRPDAPLVYLTMGTVFNDPAPLGVILAALGELDVRVVVTVGPHADPDALGEQPSHVRVERYVAQTRVLEHSDVVVSHAGSGTVLASLTLGLPQLCLPQGADQFLNAAAIPAAGAGITLMPDQVHADAVRDAVGRLLADDSFRDVARRVSTSIAAMPSPDDVGAVLETLLAGA
jgi:UDP:flavonoid glycosyltransferase YjiC (YdhE family)